MQPFIQIGLRPVRRIEVPYSNSRSTILFMFTAILLPAILPLFDFAPVEAAAQPETEAEQKSAILQEVDDRSSRHVRYGRELHNIGDYQGAITVYTEAIRLDRYNIHAYYLRGVARADNGDLDNALNDYSEAIDIDPDYTAAWVQRGMALLGKKDYESALTNFSEAIRLNPENPLIWYQRGSTKFEMEEFDGAIKDYNEVLKLKKDFTEALVNRGLAKARLGKIKSAIRDYEKALRTDSGSARAYYLRGNAFFQQGDIKGAISDFDRAIRSDPRLPGPYIMRGFFYYAQYNISKALDDLTFGLRLIKDEEGKDYVNLWLWLIHSQRDESAMAQKGLQKYLEKRSEKETGDWYEKIAHFILGEIDEETFLADAVSQDQKLEKEQLCEAYFYAAQLRLLKDDKAGAASLLRLCLATGIVDFYEYKGAKIQMILLEKELGPLT